MIEITCDGKYGKVKVDGVEIKHITSIWYVAKGGYLPACKITTLEPNGEEKTRDLAFEERKGK